MSARLGLPRAAVGSARVVGAAVGGAGGGSVAGSAESRGYASLPIC